MRYVYVCIALDERKIRRLTVIRGRMIVRPAVLKYIEGYIEDTRERRIDGECEYTVPQLLGDIYDIYWLVIRTLSIVTTPRSRMTVSEGKKGRSVSVHSGEVSLILKMPSIHSTEETI